MVIKVIWLTIVSPENVLKRMKLDIKNKFLVSLLEIKVKYLHMFTLNIKKI